MRGGAAKIFLELVCLLLCRAQWPRQPAQYGYCPHRRKLQPTMSNTCKEKIMSRPKIKSKNDVKEGSCFKSIPVSSGWESYVLQVTPHRHQATARKLKDKLNIATWNIRTLLQKGKLENIKQEMERMKLNILGLSEVRWKGAGKITSGGHEIIYSGGTESEKGVGIIVDQTASKAIKGYWALSDRVLLVKIARKPVDLNIIQVTIRKRQATFLGHVMRGGKLEHLVVTGKFEEKRSRGRQREKIMDGLATWLGPGKVSDILAAVKDRDLWRDMIANAYKQGT
ncbi:craniofacial development protein 2-like [Plakobranchus ocellatus]|uniref:Craniofacial development protein 2-like n=1 Tax=Plakobranchus ocellatus TaxID=259542 RepID=A0AAV4B6M1_9GAST|nr:craniofacial development protein 2-like [Plakobranchus ocellatus]